MLRARIRVRALQSPTKPCFQANQRHQSPLTPSFGPPSGYTLLSTLLRSSAVTTLKTSNIKFLSQLVLGNFLNYPGIKTRTLGPSSKPHVPNRSTNPRHQYCPSPTISQTCPRRVRLPLWHPAVAGRLSSRYGNCIPPTHRVFDGMDNFLTIFYSSPSPPSTATSPP